MICPNCKNSYLPGQRFCKTCGTKLEGLAPNQAAPVNTQQPPNTAYTNPPTGSRMRRADEVEYKVHGEDIQFVEIMLDPGETIIAEAGAMMYMDSAIKMDTIFGDGSGKESNDLMGKLFSAGKRVLTGESLFMTTFTNTAASNAVFLLPHPIPVQ